MEMKIICKVTNNQTHSFYLRRGSESFFLFWQKYRKGVERYYGRGVSLSAALDFSRAKYDSAIIRTMRKLPMYIKSAEKEYDITVLRQTVKKLGKVG